MSSYQIVCHRAEAFAEVAHAQFSHSVPSVLGHSANERDRTSKRQLSTLPIQSRNSLSLLYQTALRATMGDSRERTTKTTTTPTTERMTTIWPELDFMGWSRSLRRRRRRFAQSGQRRQEDENAGRVPRRSLTRFTIQKIILNLRLKIEDGERFLLRIAI